ncbi:MAG: hypothetical protein E7518_08965 [Ruminococcaceae bacterium]|nr:hypothetical protein [Oscillospiraceae bacterium]
MDTIIGVLMITLSVGILVFFRPRFQSSRILSGIALAMGLMTLGTASGDMVYQLFQLAMQATVAVCCVLQIRREAVLRARRAARKRSSDLHRASREARNCA